MLRFDEGVAAVVQKGGRGGCEPYCQNLRPRYRSTHRHTLEEPTEGKGREREERERGRTQRSERERKTGCRNATKRRRGKERRIAETEGEEIHFYSTCSALEYISL